jgi:nitroreductase
MQAAPSIESVDIWLVKNIALLPQTFVYAATSHGLATSMMEGYDIRRIKEILRVPGRYAVPLMCCVGYEYENLEGVKRTPRLVMEEVVFGDMFGELLDLNEEDDEEKEDVI